MLRRIHVRYRLELDDDDGRATAERVHGFHAERCPVYRSIHPQIACTTALEMVTAPA